MGSKKSKRKPKVAKAKKVAPKKASVKITKAKQPAKKKASFKTKATLKK